MTSNAFLLCCLNYEFYAKYKKYLVKDLIPKELQGLYETLTYSLDKNKQDIALQDLRDLHYAKNPTLTEAKKATIDILLDKLKETEPYNPNIAEEILLETWKSHHAHLLTEEAVRIKDGKVKDLSKFRELFQTLNDFTIRADSEYVPIDAIALKERRKNNNKWSWCFGELQDRIGNIGPTNFIVVAARPDAGKTAFHTNFTWNRGGWLDQGAKVHVLANEEHPDNLAVRGFACYIGQEWDTVAMYPERANEVISKVQKNIYIRDAVSWTTDDVHTYCKEHTGNMDILILDQIDKLGIRGEFSRTDERLGAVYVQAREIAKRYGIAVIAITQASNDAHDKLYYGFECLAGSKTGKAAEADVVITIGMKAIESTQGADNGIRVINLSKNKLTGNKNPVQYVLNHKLSRVDP